MWVNSANSMYQKYLFMWATTLIMKATLVNSYMFSEVGQLAYQSIV